MAYPDDKQHSRIKCDNDNCNHHISTHTEEGCRVCGCIITYNDILNSFKPISPPKAFAAKAAASFPTAGAGEIAPMCEGCKHEMSFHDAMIVNGAIVGQPLKGILHCRICGCKIDVVDNDARLWKKANQEEIEPLAKSEIAEVLNRRKSADSLGEEIAARYNSGKTMMSIVSSLAYWAAALDYTFGAMKYEANNWAKGMAWSEIMNSFERHWFAFKMGEDIDEESGLPHIIMALWNVMTLTDYTFTQKEFDDRLKYPPEILAQLRELQKTVNERVQSYVQEKERKKAAKAEGQDSVPPATEDR